MEVFLGPCQRVNDIGPTKCVFKLADFVEHVLSRRLVYRQYGLAIEFEHLMPTAKLDYGELAAIGKRPDEDSDRAPSKLNALIEPHTTTTVDKEDKVESFAPAE